VEICQEAERIFRSYVCLPNIKPKMLNEIKYFLKTKLSL